MQGIRYRLHFLILIPAAVVLWFVSRAGDAIPDRGSDFFLFFSAMGVLHASSLVISLRDRTVVTPGKVIIFISLVGVLSVVTVFSPWLLVPFLKVFGQSPMHGQSKTLMVFVILAFASAFGASGYWLLLRSFWLKSRKFVNLITTIALCSATTVVSFLDAGSLTSRSRNIGDLVPTLGWWAAFSFSLYCGDLKWRSEKSISTTPEDAHV
jgi:hypothetical protein